MMEEKMIHADSVPMKHNDEQTTNAQHLFLHSALRNDHSHFSV